MAKSKTLIGCLGVLIIGLIIVVLSVGGTYNSLVKLDQSVKAQLAKVESSYQRRADLIPNLVETVKGAAAFEKDTFTAVAEARAKVGQVKLDESVLNNPGALAKFQESFNGLDSALSRLMVVVEKYPELQATQAFRDLQTQIEGTENRINVERNRYNEEAQAFNTKRNKFPTVLIAGFFGEKFKEKAFFQAQAGAETAPKVKF
jgi:LemA protein